MEEEWHLGGGFTDVCNMKRVGDAVRKGRVYGGVKI